MKIETRMKQASMKLQARHRSAGKSYAAETTVRMQACGHFNETTFGIPHSALHC